MHNINKPRCEIPQYADYLLALAMTEGDSQRQQMDVFEREIRKMPEGGISRKRINGGMYYYHILKSNDKAKPEHYIQKKITKHQVTLLRLLIRKRFLIKSIKSLKNNQKVISTFVKNYMPFLPFGIGDKLFGSVDASNGCDLDAYVEHVHRDNHSDRGNRSDNIDCINYIKYIDSIDSLKTIWEEKWLKEPYEKNKAYPEKLIHTTTWGVKVRSKSESLIAGILEMNNIPYRYEARLTLDEQDFYPDFTILNPRNGKPVYWEHFGMINDGAYFNSMVQKLASYIRNGILPWETLITTCDSEEGSINALVIHNIVKAFLIKTK